MSIEILIIGTGSDIPPKGWGAVEAIITEHLKLLPRKGVNVDLINTFDWNSLACMVKAKGKKYDFIHSHYDIQYPYLKACADVGCSVGAMSSHFPYITNEEMYNHFGYWKVMDYFLDDQHNNLNFCISQRDLEYFRSKGVPENKLYRMFIGAPENIVFSNDPKLHNKSIYLGKICARKRQEIYGHLDNIDFVGNVTDEDVSANVNNLKSYLGEWDKDKVYSELTNYANLVLLSQGEDTPLVVREALIAGCGIVVSECAANELDTSLPFITVISDNKLNDFNYIQDKIEENKQISLESRKEINQYGIDNFGWESCTNKYLEEIKRAINSKI